MTAKTYIPIRLMIVLFLASLVLLQSLALADSEADDLKLDVDGRVDQGSYSVGDSVTLSFSLTNHSAQTVGITSASAIVRDISSHDGQIIAEVDLADSVLLGAGESVTFDPKQIWTVPQGSPAHAYGVYIACKYLDGTRNDSYQTFFRVVEDGMLTAYRVDRKGWQRGLNVYALDGGMSAEYAVEKAVEALDTGVSHSWHVNAPGSGPNHVYATPRFLELALKETVDVYDSALGTDAEFETVIITPGFASIPYLSNTLKAPVLPLQFLVSFDTVKEVRGILDQAAMSGYSAYTTVGHDTSVPMGVAWIKLLDLPKPYADFIARHQVKNVLILGCTGTAGGETKARKVVRPGDGGEYQPGDIYIMYPGTSPDDAATLNEKIRDLEEFELREDFMWVADWESGIADAQITGFVKSLKRDTKVSDIRTVTAKDLIGLYNLAAYSTAAFIHKNPNGFGDTETPIKGITLNPYLISHPWIETRAGYIPIVYWQGNPPSSTIGRVRSVALRAIEAYFPKTDPDSLEVHLNSSNNFGSAFFATGLTEALAAEGYTRLRENDYSHDEVWNPQDGMEAPCELLAEELVGESSAAELKAWYGGLVPLTPDDLVDISERFPEFVVETK